MFTKLLTLILIFTVFTIPACAAYETILTPTDSGKLITVEHGDTFKIKLPQTGGTGYSWSITLSKGLKIVSKKTIPTMIPGGQQIQEFRIKAIGNGMQSVKGVYKRSWEKKSKKTFRVKIDVELIPKLESTSPNFKPQTNNKAFC